MARAVLDEVDDWFRREVYQPLRAADPPAERLAAMFTAVETYFASRHLSACSQRSRWGRNVTGSQGGSARTSPSGSTR